MIGEEQTRNRDSRANRLQHSTQSAINKMNVILHISLKENISFLRQELNIEDNILDHIHFFK